MNWGGFAAGLAQGFNNGVSMGKTFNELNKQRKLEDIRTKGLEEAKGMQQAAAADLVKEVGVAAPAAPETVTPDTRNVLPERKVASVEVGAMPEIAAQTGVAPAKRFAVGDQTFNTRDDAMAAATKKAPSVMDFMSKTLVPRMQEAYMAQGNVEQAEAWGKWAEERQGKKAMTEWAGAWRAAQLGNLEKAADHVFNLYKTYDDGITPLSKEAVKDNDGNVTGFNVKLKVDDTGEERTQFIDRKALTDMGLSALSPPKMFEMQFKRQQEADKQRAEIAGEIAKEGRAEAREIAKEGRAQQYEIAKEGRGEAIDTRKAARNQNYELEKLGIQKQLEAAGATSKTKQEANAKMDFLRGAGYSEEFIRDAMPGILGIGDYKKRTAPEEVRRMLLQERLKDVYGFGKKTPEEQKAIIDNDVKLVMGGATSAASPAAGGLPAQGGKPSGVPVFDTKTGTIVYR